MRLIFDMLHFNAETAHAAYLRLSQLMELLYDRGAIVSDGVSNAELSMMFSDAWAIIRSCHSIFEIIRKEKVIEIGIAPEDEKHGDVITKARNKMDHIVGNIGNYAKKTNDTMPPLLGILTACFVPKCERGAQVDVLQAIALSHSDFHHKINLNVFPSDEELFPFSGWIAHVRLHAFDYIVELSKVAEFVVRLQSALAAAYSGPKQERLNVIIEMRGAAPFTVTWT